MLKLPCKPLDTHAKLPEYGTEGAACFDFYARIPFGSWVSLAHGERASIGTGIAVAVPEGYVLYLFSRSGHGAKHGVRLGNCVGVIDSDYRGEIKLIITNDGQDTFEVHDGERFAQGMLMPYPKVVVAWTAELPATKRGAGGLGSTGR